MGLGQSSLEVMRTTEAASSLSNQCAINEALPGDAAISTQRGLEDICRDGWAWQQQNPEGYESASPMPAH